MLVPEDQHNDTEEEKERAQQAGFPALEALQLEPTEAHERQPGEQRHARQRGDREDAAQQEEARPAKLHAREVDRQKPLARLKGQHEEEPADGRAVARQQLAIL